MACVYSVSLIVSIEMKIAQSFQPRLSELQELVQNMCGWEGNGFPGCQPVSMDKKNINFLHREPYHVSWKADGTRYVA